MGLREHFILEININILSTYISEFMREMEFKNKKNTHRKISCPMQPKANQLFLLFLAKILE